MASGWRKTAIGMGVLALHALVVILLVRAILIPNQNEPAIEATLFLLPLPKPAAAEKKPAVTPASAEPSHAITLPKMFEVPPQWRMPDDAPAAQTLGASLGCGATNYDSLSAEQRAACGHGPWRYDARTRETQALIIKAPVVMSAAERAERIRSTVDPCAAEKLAHIPFCIHKIIYGDKLP